RIELGEIAHAISQVTGSGSSYALVRERETSTGKAKYLVGYYVPEETSVEMEDRDILEALSAILPGYMVPSALVRMESFPLTVNGKLDRRALPKPEMVSGEGYVAPVNETEAEICRIWQEVLGIERVGTQDDFFKIGGNSILCIRLVSSMNVQLKSQISVKDIFNYKTISKLLGIINDSKGDFKYNKYSIEKGFVNENEGFELTNVQQAYLFGRLDIMELGNISTQSYSEMKFSDFDPEKFEIVLNILIQRHSSLRTIFKNEQQYILSNISKYEMLNHGRIDEEALQHIRNRLATKIYNTSKWPLFDFELSQFEDYTILHLSIEGLIVDGASMRTFFKELIALYNSEDISRVKLPKLEINFKDYVEKYQAVRNSHMYLECKKYWENKMSDYDFEAQLPVRVNPKDILKPSFRRITKTIPIETWELIKAKAIDANVGATSVILFVYGLVLSKWSGKSKFCINLTLSNRLPLHKQVNDILGDFTVLELFNFHRLKHVSLKKNLVQVHDELWNDIENNLFDGIDFQRLIRTKLALPKNQILSPVVLTSGLGNTLNKIPLKGYAGQGYSITQTSQVYLDNKAYITNEGLIAEWDYVDQLFSSDVISQMHA
ncbi:condensation domain-containing protein, partial [Croceitalea sp. MTPC5]|uniref:condensation domain-containing protein n=1 Tax=Croceitalea sp. MTPC5 TaxID=3056565 RepID=UPI0030D39F01